MKVATLILSLVKQLWPSRHANQAADPPPESREPDIRSMPHPPTILVISSDRMVRFFTNELEAQGYRVHSATSAVASVVVYRKTAPDLILIMEHFIEGASEAMGLCQHLRDVAGPDLPIVFIATMSGRAAAADLGVVWLDLMGGITEAFTYIHDQLPLPPDADSTSG